MSFFSRYEEPSARFLMVAGPEQRLATFLVAAGRLATGEGGPLHLHHGDEMLRILSGDLEVTVGDEVRLCRAGDIVAVQPDTLHGFQTITEARLEVVAVRGAGQVFPVYLPDGPCQLTEVYRQDMPWSRTPPAGFSWTTDEQMADVLRYATPPPDRSRRPERDSDAPRIRHSIEPAGQRSLSTHRGRRGRLMTRARPKINCWRLVSRSGLVRALDLLPFGVARRVFGCGVEVVDDRGGDRSRRSDIADHRISFMRSVPPRRAVRWDRRRHGGSSSRTKTRWICNR